MQLEDFYPLTTTSEISFGDTAGFDALAHDVTMSATPLGFLHLARWRLRMNLPTPVGSIFARLYDFTGTIGTDAVPDNVLAVSDPVDSSTVPSTPANGNLIDFPFSGVNRIALLPNQQFMLSFEADLVTGGRLALRQNGIESGTHGEAKILDGVGVWAFTNNLRAAHLEIYSDAAGGNGGGGGPADTTTLTDTTSIVAN